MLCRQACRETARSSKAYGKLAAPSDWEAPDDAEVTPEQTLESGRIDICIRDRSMQRVVGIKAKTTEASAHEGQLDKYHDGLQKRFPEHRIQIAYLTPFNRRHAKGNADLLPTVRAFSQIRRDFPGRPALQLARRR